MDILNIDCMEYMKDQEDNAFDLAIVDPPYGIDIAKENKGGSGWVAREGKDWDKNIPDADYFEQLFRVSKNQIIWGGNYFTKYLPSSMGWLFWDKGQREFSLADGELAFTSFKQALRVIFISRARSKNMNDNEGGRIHPTQKPVELYSWLLRKLSAPGQKILDTHLGSGSSAIAAHYFGCDFVGCELDKEYYEAAKNRIEIETKQLEFEFC